MNSHKCAHNTIRKAIAVVVIASVISLIAPVSIAVALLTETPRQLLNLLGHIGARTSTDSNASPSSSAVDKRRSTNSKSSPALTRAEREAEVADIRMNCSECKAIHSQEPLQFIGVPVDSRGDAINGLGVQWFSSNNEVLTIDSEGRANPKKPGRASLYATTQNRTKSFDITVLKQREKRSSSNSSMDNTHHPSSPLSWDVPESEVGSLYKAENIVGVPEGKIKPIGAGESSAVGTTETGVSNFNFSREVITLPGRGGLDAKLFLVLNSQVWTKTFNLIGNPIHRYDVDSGWPAPGFRLGFGQIEKIGNASQPTNLTLTDPDGTRRALKVTTTNNYDTHDGSFIHYTMVTGGGTLFYPDGSQVTYGAAGSGKKSYPTRITDRNGNYISIAYKDGLGPKIDTIKDTLERYISFFYASSGDLVAIKAPGLTTGSERQVMRFYYDTVSLTTADLFETPIVRPTSARVVKYIFSPSSSAGAYTGFRFDYSVYGMVHTVKEFRGMTVSSDSLTDTGSVTSDGIEAASAAYNYPTTANDLVDPPNYTERTDDWAGRTGGGSAPVHTFSIAADESEVVSTVQAPDGTITETHATVDPGFWADGLVTQVLVQYKPTPTATPVLVSETQLNWEENTANATGRLKDIRVTNDASPRQTKSVIYGYDDANTPYNNVSVVSETDFTTDGSLGTVLRRTEITYVTSSAYLNRRLYNLPAQKRVYAGSSGSPISRIDFTYDQSSLTTRSGILMFDPAFDPSSGFYVSTNAYRGNLTTTTTYPDATTTANAISRGMSYDIAGNMITAQMDCCQVKSFTYTSTNQYAYPISETSGNTGGPQLTTSTSYDYNTGLVLQETDANSQPTSFTYEPVSLRLGQVDRPDGGEITYDYSDALIADSAARKHSYVVQSVKLDSTRFISGRSYFDGRGALTQTFSDYTSTNGWSIQDIEYDSMGRAFRIANPYYCTSDYGTCSINPSGIWRTISFDRLNRVTQITKPRGDDANPSLTVSLQASYVGSTITVTDEAGRQRRQKTDALGRVIRVDEPDSSGSLGSESTPNQSTSYQYDVLNNLVKITQLSQNRYFKYDSLSRMIREFQVEQVANASYNLSDSLTGNISWTRKLEYNSDGLVTHTYDARGVQTDFYYDTLNRLTLIDYSDSTPDARYFYDSQTLPSGAPTFTRGSSNGRVVALTYGSTGSTAGTYFGYDAMGRVNLQKQVTGTTTYSLAYTYNLAGMLSTETYPTGRVLTHSYDNAGRTSQVSDGTTIYTSGLSYAASRGLLSETWGNGAVHSRAYNNALQLSQVKLKQSNGGSELQRYDYLYGEVTQSNGSVDKSKNRGQVARVDGIINGSASKEWDQRFTYDELGRVSTAAEYQQGTGSTPTWKQEFTYDRYGNRFQSGTGNTGVGFTQVVSSDITAATNRFISTGSTPITYDAAGNVTQDEKFRLDPQGDGMNYTYDATGRQITAAGTDEIGSQSFVYDCAGLRVQTSGHNFTRQMVYNIFGQLVVDYKDGSLERENVYRDGELLAVQEAASTWYKTLDQFIKDFYQGALGRQPNSTELTDWTNTLGPAQARGARALIGSAQALGNSLFLSSEYSAMGTTPTQFVTDLYEAFLQRAPDGPGLDHWVPEVNANGRDAVRLAFAVCPEFSNNVAALAPGTSTSTSTNANLKYVLLDHQGSVRALMNNNGVGTSTIISRHDYLPFGEEIWAGVGLRTATQKYATTDKVRQRFALTERDEATGLDHTWFRKFESYAGRWTSVDPYTGSQNTTNPQSMNRQTYTGNDPVNLIDPTGLVECWALVRTTILHTTGQPDQILGVKVLEIFCTGGVGGTGDRLQKLLDTEWRGTKIVHSVRRATDAEMKANPKIVQQARFQECMNGKYEDLKKEFGWQLEQIMGRHLRNAVIAGIVGALLTSGFVGPLNGFLAGAASTYPAWVDAVRDFEAQKLGPAREKAKADCRKQAGMAQ